MCLFKQRTHSDNVARNHDYVVKSSATVSAVVEQAARAGERYRRPGAAGGSPLVSGMGLTLGIEETLRDIYERNAERWLALA
jgi:hypothetical protein